MRILLRIIFSFFASITFISSVWGNTVPIQIVPRYDTKQYDAAINQLYQKSGSHAHSINSRINFDSAYFLGKPYSMFPLGEGANAYFDKNPLYRTDIFDCMTYVDTVLALANANNLAGFQKAFKAISYENGKVTFLTRNHFVADDWNQNNAQAGFIRDVTISIKDANNRSPVRNAVTIIDKPNWYKMMSPNRIRVFFYPGNKQAQQLLKALREQASEVKAEKISTPYIPMAAFFDAKGQPKQFLFNQIPSNSIVEIVRPNWDLTKLIGTHLNVSHLGFAIRTPQGLMFREASMDNQRVLDIPMATYFQTLSKLYPTEGVNIEEIRN